jgi:hypothetical protein
MDDILGRLALTLILVAFVMAFVILVGLVAGGEPKKGSVREKVLVTALGILIYAVVVSIICGVILAAGAIW